MNTTGVITPADDVLFGDLCSLLEQLQKKKKHRPEQNKLLSNFVDQFRLKLANTQGSKNSTFFPILRLLLPSCDRERGPYNLKETRLSTLLVKVLSLNKESTDAKQLIHFSSSNNSVLDSDFPGVAFYVIKKRVGQNNSVLTVREINEILNSVATVDNVHKTPLDDIFSYALKKLTAIEFKWLLRIILKDLKLSMSSDRILGIFHPDAPEVFKNCSSILKVCEELEDGDTRPSELGVNLFYAVRPMLSERLDITHIHVLDKTKTYCMEEKFDGERFQMHMDNNVFEYFSRKGFKYSKNYGQSYDSGMLTPYLKDIFAPEARNFILDGEMMGWHKIDNYFGCKAMSYDVKKITENSSFRPCFCVFDILYYNDRPLIGSPDKGGLPLRERLKILDDLFIDKRGVIEHSKRKIIKESSEVVDAVNDAIDNQDEGIVVKDINSYYIANKRNAGWYKIKPEYTDDTMNDLDLVVVGADEATNKRQGRAKSFYVACRDNNDGDPVWTCIGRVSNGLKHEEKERVCSLLERNWCMYRKKPPPPCLRFGKDKPDFWILPEHSIVLQVRATELLSVGDSHVLRFPRVEDIRSDKPVDDVCTIHELRQLAVSRSPVSKLSTKRVNESQIDQNYIKTRKRGLSKTVQVPEKFRTKTIGDVQVISRALFGKKLCVLSDDEDCKKTELKRVIESHGGRHVENPGSDTWCCVVGTMTPRSRRLIETQDLDIISTAWLRSLPATDEPCHLSPLDMLSMKPETKLKLSLDYDPFGDSYKDEIDEKTLKKLLDKMDSELPLYPTLKEKVCLDKQLFGANNPFSFLRNCFIHVIDNSLYGTMASFFGAKICSLDDVRLTHVVMSKDANVKIDKGILVSDGWLEECFNKRSFVPVDDYLI
ncbi:DNA ligase 4 [Danaus plexippus]|uniref:DNA ligase 4 n=1 Tax=Danaus plexippus TaxID=13037 RepID=UPI002AB30DDE|nr:DNA ligase 4 [Danaus plexippus]